MKTALFGISSAVILIVATPAHAQSAQAGKAESSKVVSPQNKSVHLVVDSDAKAREIFTYFPYPILPAAYRYANINIFGIYRLQVDANGGVTAVTILRSMGRVMDVTAMKAFILWRANPGPVRVVDVPWRVGRRRVFRPWR